MPDEPTNVTLRRWRKKHRLSLDEAARTIHRSRTWLSEAESGKDHVKTVQAYDLTAGCIHRGEYSKPLVHAECLELQARVAHHGLSVAELAEMLEVSTKRVSEALRGITPPAQRLALRALEVISPISVKKPMTKAEQQEIRGGEAHYTIHLEQPGDEAVIRCNGRSLRVFANSENGQLRPAMELLREEEVRA